MIFVCADCQCPAISSLAITKDIAVQCALQHICFRMLQDFILKHHFLALQNLTVSKIFFITQGFQYANIFFHRHCMMSLEITSKDKSYPWVLTWISRHAERSTQHLGVETSFTEAETGAIHAQYHFVPSVGDHYFRLVM